jgi:autotransporter translocation and assembly factor TamB
MIKRIAWFVMVILLVLIGTVGAALIWLGSDGGRDWLVRQAEHYSEGAILISGLQGHPLSRLTAASIEYRDTQMNILGQEAEFSWTPMALFSGSLNILSLSVTALQVHELAGGEATTGPGSDIPFGLISRLRLHAFHIGNIEVFDPEGKAGAKLKNISVDELVFSPRLSGIVKLESEGKTVQMELAGTIDDWEIKLGAHPLSGQFPAVDIKLAGQMLEQGSMQLKARLEQGEIQSEGKWAYTDGLIKAEAGLEAEGQSAQIHLDGKLDDWKLRIKAHPLQGQYPGIDLQLAGQTFERASMQLNAKLEQGTLQTDGLWTITEGLIGGEGTLQADFIPAKVHGQWQLKVETETSAVQLSLVTDVDAGPQFNRQLHLTVDADMEDGKLKGIVHESGQALKAEWGFSDGVLQLKAQMDKWMVPLTQAAGIVSGVITASVNIETSAWKVEADMPESKVAGLMASLNIAGEGDGEIWQLHRGNITLLGVTIDASGKGDIKGGQVQGQLHSKNLKAALALAGSKQGGGVLDGGFRLSGTMIEPKLDWNVQLKNLESDWVNLSQLQSKGWLLPNKLQGETSVNASDIHLEGGQSWQRLEMQAGLQEQTLSVQSTALGEIGWHIQMMAKGQDKNWAGKVGKLSLDYQNKSVLAMNDLPWRWHADTLQVPESNIRIANIPARISLLLDDKSPQIHLKVPSVEVKALKPWLDESQLDGIDGSVHLDLALGGTWEKPSLSLKSGSDQLSMQWPDADIDMSPPILENLQLSASYGKQLLQWQLSSTASGDSKLHSEGRVPWLFSLRPWVFSSVKNRPGRAGLSLQVRDLAILQPLVPKLYPLVGNASVTLDVRNPFGKLQTDAAMNLAFTSLGIPELGLDMHGQALANWQKNRGSVDIEMKSGDGTLTVQGPVTWPLEKMPAINFKQFPVIQRPDQQLIIDGYLDMKQQKKQSWIKGKVTASQLNIEIPESQPKPTSDLEWSQQEYERKPGADLPLTQLDVTLNLGQAAEIYGRGMKMRLAGQLHLTGSMRKPQLTGELTIPKGGIDYRNIHLDVLPKSRLVFTGDPERPLLYVQAGRKIDNILVGVQIEGPGDRLQSRLFSNPSMPDAEILAYLVTGRSLSSLGKDGAVDALSVAGFLLGPGSALQDVQNKVQRSLGLDSMEVSAGTESSKVAVGKKIGKRTTVKLEETIAAGSTTAVTLEYLLTNSITVFARQVQNAAPTLGLRYRKEWTGKAVKP